MERNQITSIDKKCCEKCVGFRSGHLQLVPKVDYKSAFFCKNLNCPCHTTHQDSGIEKIIEEFEEKFCPFINCLHGELATQSNQNLLNGEIAKDFFGTKISQLIKETIVSIEAGNSKDSLPHPHPEYTAGFNEAKDENINILKALLPKQ